MQAKLGRSSGSAAILKVNSGLFQSAWIDTIEMSSRRWDWPRSDCKCNATGSVENYAVGQQLTRGLTSAATLELLHEIKQETVELPNLDINA
jgi:hypothetical protein